MQMRQNAVNFLLHSLEIYGTLYLIYIALWAQQKIIQFYLVSVGGNLILITKTWLSIPHCCFSDKNVKHKDLKKFSLSFAKEAKMYFDYNVGLISKRQQLSLRERS